MSKMPWDTQTKGREQAESNVKARKAQGLAVVQDVTPAPAVLPDQHKGMDVPPTPSTSYRPRKVVAGEDAPANLDMFRTLTERAEANAATMRRVLTHCETAGVPTWLTVRVVGGTLTRQVKEWHGGTCRKLDALLEGKKPAREVNAQRAEEKELERWNVKRAAKGKAPLTLEAYRALLDA